MAAGLTAIALSLTALVGGVLQNGVILGWGVFCAGVGVIAAVGEAVDVIDINER
jgi:hypothetical protein